MLSLIGRDKKLTWTKDLSVGNAIIDAEHKNLICIVNDVAHAIKVRDCSTVAHTFEMLEKWLHVHFMNEEQIAQAVEFDFSRHRHAHQNLLKEIQYMRDELVEKDGGWSDNAVDHFTRSLKYWMVDKHILELDMQMKPALQNYAYEFIPVGPADAAHPQQN